MENKVLFCATVDYHFQKFHLPYLKWFKEQGWEVHVAAQGNMELPYVDQKYNISIQRSPFRLQNMRAYRELKHLVDHNDYRLIHCHTPMGGVLGRLAARQARKRGTHVLYTAHGFHFCKGAPLLNWMLYYPIERWLARYTDCLITINQEDYRLATEHRFQAKRIEHVHGVGVDIEQFRPVTEPRKRELKRHYGYRDDHILLFYAAEFNKNKNQQLLIRALAVIKAQYPKVLLLLAGEGPMMDACRRLCIQYGVEHMVRFLGYRNDIHELLPACDLAVGSSLREGLPVNIMEAMACGLPIIATENRGHNELVDMGKSGWIVPCGDERRMAARIGAILENELLRVKFGAVSRAIVNQKYSIQNVLEEKQLIYSTYMEEVGSVQWASR